MKLWVRGADLVSGIFLVWPLLLPITAAEQGQDEYADPTKNSSLNHSKVSCDFKGSMCLWQNVGGYNYSLTWKKKSDYMHLSVDGAKDHDKGRLASPWLEPLHDASCRLTFRYFIRNSDYLDCRLSLFRQTASGEELSWTTQRPTGYTGFSNNIAAEMNCSKEEFRIVFEGQGSCHVSWYDEIDIKSIIWTVRHSGPGTWATVSPWTGGPEEIMTINQTYTGTPDLSTRDSTDSTLGDSATTAAGTRSNTGAGADSRVKDDGDDNERSGLDAGVTAGITIAISFVVVVFAVLFILVIVVIHRRRQRDKSTKNSIRRSISRAATNSIYMQGPGGVIGDNVAARADPPTSPAASEGDHYELADVAPSPRPATAATGNTSTHNYHIATTPQTHVPPAADASTFNNPYDHIPVFQPPRHTTTTTTTTSSPASASLDSAGAAAPPSVNLPASCADDTHNARDQTNGTSLPSVGGSPGDLYNHLELSAAPGRGPGAQARDYMDIEGGGQSRTAATGPSDSNTSTQPCPDLARPHRPPWNSRSPPPPSPVPTSAQAPNADYEIIHDLAESTKSSPANYEISDDVVKTRKPLAANYENVDGAVKSLPEGGDVCDRLDVKGERGERVVGVGVVMENVYDHAKGDNYDSLDQEGRWRQRQRQMAQNDYSHA
ncbi:hypothetical protein ACOMHN_001336 [Nucella lapillus]